MRARVCAFAWASSKQQHAAALGRVASSSRVWQCVIPSCASIWPPAPIYPPPTLFPPCSYNPPVHHQIIMAVNDYTKALQDGLRIVANT